MHIIITGGAGHVSKPLALELLDAGHSITVLGRNPENLESITENGAQAAIGSLEDRNFVVAAFKGGDAAYLMIPPNFVAEDFRGYQQAVIDNYVAALRENRIGKVVVLSSIGAHMGSGAGPVDGLAALENAITRELPDVDAVFLRPAFFYYNLFQQAGLIKHLGIMGSNYPMKGEKLFLVDTRDIAAAAFEALNKAEFSGRTVLNLYSDERNTDEIAEVLGSAIGKPGTPWVPFPDDQALAGMLQAGIKPAMAADYVQMGIALREGAFQSDFRAQGARQGKVRLEDFAQSFNTFFHNQ